jgi:hypothetical protein
MDRDKTTFSRKKVSKKPLSPQIPTKSHKVAHKDAKTPLYATNFKEK